MCLYVCVCEIEKEREYSLPTAVCVLCFGNGEDSSVGVDAAGAVAGAAGGGGEGRLGSPTDGTLPPVNGSSTSLTCLPPILPPQPPPPPPLSLSHTHLLLPLLWPSTLSTRLFFCIPFCSFKWSSAAGWGAVSYTHLTLPTIVGV